MSGMTASSVTAPPRTKRLRNVPVTVIAQPAAGSAIALEIARTEK